MSGFGSRNETLIPPGMGELDIFELPKAPFEGEERIVVLSATKPPRRVPAPDSTTPVQATREVAPETEEVKPMVAPPNEKVDLVAEALEEPSLAPRTPSPMDWRPEVPEDHEYERPGDQLEIKAEYVAFAASFVAVVGIGVAAIFTLF